MVESRQIERIVQPAFSLFVPLLLVMISTGCGTLGGAEQVISVDSTRRGEPIYFRDGSYIAKTPFFTEVLPEPKLMFWSKQSGTLKMYRFRCDFRWWMSPLENTPLFLIGAPFGSLTPFGALGGGVGSILAGVMTDTISGAAFMCPNQFVIEDEVESAQIPLVCAIQTPPELSNVVRSKLIAKWMSSDDGKRQCSSVLDGEKMLEQARTVKLPRDLSQVGSKQRARVYRFGYETGAGRLIIFSRAKKGTDRPKLTTAPNAGESKMEGKASIIEASMPEVVESSLPNDRSAADGRELAPTKNETPQTRDSAAPEENESSLSNDRFAADERALAPTKNETPQIRAGTAPEERELNTDIGDEAPAQDELPQVYGKAASDTNGATPTAEPDVASKAAQREIKGKNTSLPTVSSAGEPIVNREDKVAGKQESAGTKSEGDRDEIFESTKQVASELKLSSTKANDASSQPSQASHSNDPSAEANEAGRERYAVHPKVDESPTSLVPKVSPKVDENSEQGVETHGQTETPSVNGGKLRRAAEAVPDGFQRIRLHLKQVDLHRLAVEREENVSIVVPRMVAKDIDRIGLGGHLRRTFYLVPDAISIGRGSTNILGDDFQASAIGAPISLSKVSHPSGFGRWDYEFSVAPDVSFDVFETELSVHPRESPDEVGFAYRNQTITYRRLSLSGMAAVDAHTPIGAFGFGLRLGGIYVNASRPDDQDLSWLRGFRFRYTGFLTDSLFFHVSNSLNLNNLRLGPYGVNRIHEMYVSWGYHWTGLESVFRSLF